MAKPRILLVDDEPRLIHLVREVLSATGYEVMSCANGEQAVRMVAIEQPDLVLLDIMLPGGMDGFDVSRRLREFIDVPIIMLTARVTENDMLKGFEAGADDYITKPFNSKELIARVRAVLKRSRRDSSPVGESILQCGDLQIDLARRKVSFAGQEIHLTATEYNLLHELAVHANQVMLHDQLLVAVWGQEYRNDVDYLRAYIYNLRKKIETDLNHPRILLRCPGVGYMLVCDSKKP